LACELSVEIADLVCKFSIEIGDLVRDVFPKAVDLQIHGIEPA